MTEGEFDRQLTLALSSIEPQIAMIKLIKEQLLKNNKIDYEELEELENEEKIKIVKLDSKFTKNDIEVFKTRR